MDEEVQGARGRARGVDQQVQGPGDNVRLVQGPGNTVRLVQGPSGNVR